MALFNLGLSLLLLACLLHSSSSFINPYRCKSGGKHYNEGEKWIEDCHVCECHATFMMLMAAKKCHSANICTAAPMTPPTGTQMTGSVVPTSFEHCLQVNDCHRYFDFCRTRYESTACVNNVCQCIPNKGHPLLPYCRQASQCSDTAQYCHPLFEDTICSYGACQCVPKGAVQGLYFGCNDDSGCSGVSALCTAEHGDPICYNNYCVCGAVEPCVYEGKTYGEHEQWYDLERCWSCLCTKNSTAACLPISNASVCTPKPNSVATSTPSTVGTTSPTMGTTTTTVTTAPTTPPPCDYKGTQHGFGDSWKDLDECLTCNCESGETATCTPMKDTTSCRFTTQSTTTMTTPTTMSTTPPSTLPKDTKPVIDEATVINTTVKAGSNFTLVCTATGYPKPSIMWGHIDATGFPKTPSVLADVIVDGEKLQVMSAGPEHAGKFICRASNRAGSVTSDYFVSVLP